MAYTRPKGAHHDRGHCNEQRTAHPSLQSQCRAQLQITRLLQESGHHWLEAVQQLSAGSVLETTSRIQNLQQAADWQALATLPSEVFWRLCQGRMGDTQAVGKCSQEPGRLCRWLRQALTTWQESVSEAFGASGDAASFTQLCQHWTQPWTAPSAAPQEQDQEMRGRQ
jgi:hypothetical protein